MKADPAIATVRRAREDICTAFDHDPAKIIQHYIEMQRRFAERLRRGPAEKVVPAEQSTDESTIENRDVDE